MHACNMHTCTQADDACVHMCMRIHDTCCACKLAHIHTLHACHLCQLCINFANEKLQRMFTEAVFESILAEYKKEGIEVRARPRTARSIDVVYEMPFVHPGR